MSEHRDRTTQILGVNDGQPTEQDRKDIATRGCMNCARGFKHTDLINFVRVGEGGLLWWHRSKCTFRWQRNKCKEDDLAGAIKKAIDEIV